MSDTSNLNAILSCAKEKEQELDWCGAIESYNEALSLMSQQDLAEKGEIVECLGYASFRFAFQAESKNEFRERLQQAILSYEKAKKTYKKLTESVETPRTLRCEAMIAYLRYWLSSETDKKRRLIDRCWKLTQETLRAFGETGDSQEFGKTYNQLSGCAGMKECFQWESQAREKTLKEAIELGEKTIMFLSADSGICKLATAYVRTAAFLEAFSYFALNPYDQKNRREKALQYWQKANALSEETAFCEFFYSLQVEFLGWEPGTDSALAFFNKALEYGRKSRDKLVSGGALDWLAYHTIWKTFAVEDVDDRINLTGKALQYAEDAKRTFNPLSYTSPRAGLFWIEAPYPEYYGKLITCEADPKRRRDLREKALDAASEYLCKAESSGYPDVILLAHHILSNQLAFLAESEKDSYEKTRLLEKALNHRNESIRISEGVSPPAFLWDRGLMWSGLARIKSELADLAKGHEPKKNLLVEAAAAKEESLRLCRSHIKRTEVYGQLAVLGGLQYDHGGLMLRIYGTTGTKEHLEKAAEAFVDASDSFRKLDLVSRVAECNWKAAQTYDTLGEYSKGAENFCHASTNYRKAADKMPFFRDFYLEHAAYMQAWWEIEKAKYHHKRQEYELAKEHFENATQIHKSLKHWKYLAPNYAAWVQIELAENESRNEQSERALEAFQLATTLFNEAKDHLQKELASIESEDEREMAINVLKATDVRCQYCIARTALEEARILDKKGEHYLSSERYGSATQTLEKINQTLESEQERKEIKLIIGLSRAWQKMALAEAETKPYLYIEASQLFDEARESSPNEKTKMLLLGHSRFCKALEAGARFADIREVEMYTEAIKSLESAANFYIKAGFPKASEYSEATKLLFDAYLDMDRAAKESDPDRKAKLYSMTEKVLQTSAGCFMRAEHPDKREQVLGLMEKTRKERDIAISLTEVLHAPPIVSATNAFVTPTPTYEKAVGSERFEHPNIQASLIIHRKEVKVGENLNMEIELVNAGKGPAILTKITEMIPQGFELTGKPEIYRVEDNYLNMRGKRLDPLETEEVSITLKPKTRGEFRLKPKIQYLDENGECKAHEPESVIITVKELGLKGWLKGER